jgi:hypothetical protein
VDIDQFFNDLNEQDYKKNIQLHTEKAFDTILQSILENKEGFISEIISDLNRLEEMNDIELDYDAFNKWVNKLVKQNIINKLVD